MSGDITGTRCGFVSVLGLPNAGKSTLVNTLVGSKVSIVSRRVQTTRCRILGIAMQGDAQIILMDTPGIFAPRKNLERAMVGAAWETVEGADAIIHLVDAPKKNAVEENAQIFEKLPKNIPCLLVLNKVDSASKPELLKLSQALNEKFAYEATYMISALKGQGTKDLLKDLEGRMKPGPYMFDPEQITDMPMRFVAAEITREKVFNQLYQELPYAVLVETESWENFDNGSVKIGQVIFVQRESQKAIVLGKGGSQIKKIGEQSRKELEDILGTRVHLRLFVKVQENWEEKAENYRLIGLSD